MSSKYSMLYEDEPIEQSVSATTPSISPTSKYSSLYEDEQPESTPANIKPVVAPQVTTSQSTPSYGSFGPTPTPEAFGALAKGLSDVFGAKRRPGVDTPYQAGQGTFNQYRPKSDEQTGDVVGSLLELAGKYGKAAITNPVDVAKGTINATPYMGGTMSMGGAPMAGYKGDKDFDNYAKLAKEKEEYIKTLPEDKQMAYGTGKFVGKVGKGLAIGSGMGPVKSLGQAVSRGFMENIPFIADAVKEGTVGPEIGFNTLIDMATHGGSKLIKPISKGLGKGAAKGASNFYSPKEAVGYLGDKLKSLRKQPESVADIIPLLTDVKPKSLIKGKVDTVIDPVTKQVEDLASVKGPKRFLMDILPESETRILKERRAPKTIPFQKYASSALGKKGNIKLANPFELAATNATKAFKYLDGQKRAVGKKIDDLVKKHPDAIVDISDVKMNYLEMVDSRIQRMTTGSIPVDPGQAKIADDVGNYILELPDQLPIDEARRLKRNLQSQVNYVTGGRYEANTDIIEGIQKDIASQVNDKIAEVVPGFKSANKEYSKYAEIINNFNKRLGTEISPDSDLTMHGASIMKRAIESLTDSGGSEIFRKVKELTNGQYDLFQDAIYSSIAMRFAGDARQLQQSLPFGGIANMAMGKAGVVDKAMGAAVDLIKSPKSESTLNKISDFYNKAQSRYPGQVGATDLDILNPLARTGGGGVAGGTIGANIGETPEERRQNALAGFGIGAMGANAPQLARGARRLGQEGFIGGQKATGYDDAARKFSMLTDKKPRFEVSDRGAKFRMDKLSGANGVTDYKHTSLGDILEHEKLYDQYPELKNVDVKIQVNRGLKNTGASFKPGENRAYLDLFDLQPEIEVRAISPESARRSLLHEIQHSIQETEGFAKGGSPEAFYSDLKARKNEAESVFNQANKQMSSNVKIRDRLEKEPRTPEVKKRIKELEDDYQRLMDLKMGYLKDAQTSIMEESYKKYKNLAGEVESRAVADRSRTASDFLAKRQPLPDEKNINLADMIVDMAGGKADSRLLKGKEGAVKLGKTVDNPNFKKWFKGSKVVDEAGEPMMVFHGTNRDFKKFDPYYSGAEGAVTDEMARAIDPEAGAFFFSSTSNLANMYSMSKGGNFKPAYVKIKNPLIHDLDFKDKTPELVNSLVSSARKKGNDGVIIKNAVDFDRSGWKSGMGDIIIPFRSTQIKSATGNTGAFDPTNPDITKALLPLILGGGAMAGANNNQ